MAISQAIKAHGDQAVYSRLVLDSGPAQSMGNSIRNYVAISIVYEFEVLF
jgi:hypothetical protein